MAAKINRSDLNDTVLLLIRSIIDKYNIEYEADFIPNSYDKFLKTISCHFSSCSYRDSEYMLEKIKYFVESNKRESSQIFNELIKKFKIIASPRISTILITLLFELTFPSPTASKSFSLDVNLKQLKLGNSKLQFKANDNQDETHEEDLNNIPISSILSKYPSTLNQSSTSYPKKVDGSNSGSYLSIKQPLSRNAETFISKGVIQSLEKDPSTSPWMLISERLQKGFNESDLVSDLLCVLQGIDGSLITYDATSEHYTISSSCMLTAPVKDLILKICELGWLYRQLNNFVIEKKIKDDYGMVGQAFVLSLKYYLDDHIYFMASLDSELLMNLSTRSDTSKLSITLPGLMITTLTSQRKFIYLHKIYTSCKGFRGGALLSCIYKNTTSGDPLLSAIGKSILKEASKPINCLLTEWIYQGNLTDNFNEFFIACNKSVRNEKLWSDKYTTRESMIPSFLSSSIVEKILRIGKSINFIKTICESEVNHKTNYGMLNIGEESTKSNNGQTEQVVSLKEVVEEVDRETSTFLLQILNSKYKIYLHIDAMYRYLLLGQGDFIRHLMDLLKPYLSSKADSLRLNNMTSVLESAINSTNAQFDDKEVLERLDCKIAEPSPSDLGWDVFTLYYHTKGPLQSIVDSNSMNSYLKIFHFLWFLKRTVYLLSDLSKDQIAYSKLFRWVTESTGLIHHMNLLKTEMIHFINQLEYFITFEVLECSKMEMQRKFNEAKDLDDIIKAHSEFLTHVMSMCLLNESYELILSKLKSIFAAIIHFESLFRLIISFVMQEVDARKSQSSRTGTSNLKNTVSYYTDQIGVMRVSYRKLMADFISTLLESTNGSHDSLCFRLDFNKFYSRECKANHATFKLSRHASVLAHPNN